MCMSSAIEDAYRLTTKIVAANYLAVYWMLSDQEIVALMKRDPRITVLTRSVYFAEWILAMLVYQRNAYITFGYYIFK